MFSCHLHFNWSFNGHVLQRVQKAHCTPDVITIVFQEQRLSVVALSKQCNETSNRPLRSHKWNYVQDHWWKLRPKMSWLFLRCISERWTFDKILWKCYWEVSTFALISNVMNIFSVTFINLPSRHPNLVSNIEEVIDDGVSLMAMNSNNDIIGIRLSCIVTK